MQRDGPVKGWPFLKEVRAQPRRHAGDARSLSAGPMTAGLVGTSGFAAIPTTALDLPRVQSHRGWR